MIVRLDVDGAVVQDADDCADLRLETDLDAAGLRKALRTTGTGELVDADSAWLDLGVLRSRAKLLATTPDWRQGWAELVDRAQRCGQLSEDGHAVRVRVER